MTPFSSGQDVFRTQADSRFNSFADPMNPVNMNPGNWGINSSYMTPSYMSPFRPQYQGPQGNQYGGANPTWAQSANYIANPFRSGGDNYGGNYWQQSTPFYNSIVNRPSDQAASFAQNWAVPLIGGYASMRMFGAMGAKIGGAAGAGLTRGLIGGSMGVGATSSFMSAGKMLGGMAGGMMIPMGIASAGISAFDSAVMDPYIAQRQMSNNFRQNFAGQTFGQAGVGDPYQGGGLNRRFAAGMATSMSRFAAKDLTFNQQEVSTLTDYSARAGLLDNVNANQLTSRMKEITKQVKLVMSVANTSDFKEAIEILGKLQMAGATGGAASRVMTQLGSFAAMGGISTQKLMNTVGAQGQYLFGASGLTPYVGQLAAGQAYGSMASAFRSGLLSPALAARMGGVEGATQSAVAGMVGMASSPYAAMYAHNAYMNGGERGSIVGNVSAFGSDIARGGLKAVGAFNANRPGSISRLIEERGPKLVQDMIAQMGRMTPTSMNGKGQVDANAALMMLTQSYGIQDDQARALLEQLRSYQDPNARDQMLAGNKRSMIDNRLKAMQQYGADYGKLTPAVQSVLGIGRSVQEFSAGAIGTANENVGGLGDRIQTWWNEAKFGKTSDMQARGFAEGANIAQINSGSKRSKNRLDSFKDLYSKHTDRLNELARSGDKDAIAAISGTGVERKDALYNLARDKKIDQGFMDPTKANELMGSIDKSGVSFIANDGQGIAASLKEMFGGSRLSQSNSIIDNSIIFDVSKTLSTTTEDSSEWNAARERLQKVYGRKLSKTEIAGIINSDDIKSMQMNGANAMAGLARELGVGSETELNKLASEAGGYDALAKKKLSGKDLDFYHQNQKKLGDVNALAMAVHKANGGDLQGAKLDKTRLDHLTNAERSEILNGETAGDKSRQFITQMAKEHKIDFTTYNQNMAAIDNKEATGAFSDAVSRFSEAVGSMSKAGKLTAREVQNQVRSRGSN